MHKFGQLLFIFLLALFGFIALQARAPQIDRPWPDKQELARGLWQKREIAYVYPDQGELAAKYRRLFEARKRRRRYLKIQAIPVSQSSDLPADVPLCLVGTPASNPILAEIRRDLPVKFKNNSFRINHHSYKNADQVLQFEWPYPHDPARYLRVITGNSDRAIAAFLERGFSRWRIPGDYAIFQQGNLAAYGFFNQSHPGAPWSIAPGREQSFLRNRQTLFKDAYFAVDYIGEKPPRAEIKRFVEQQTSLLQQQFAQLEIPKSQRRSYLPIRLVLYETAESKTLVTRNSHFSSWQPDDPEIHLVFSDIVRGDDFTAIAEYVAWKWAGNIANPLMRQAVGVLFSDHWAGDGYIAWAGRLFFNGDFLTFRDLFTQGRNNSACYYIAAPQLATYLQFVLFHDGANSLRMLLQNTPAQMGDSEISRRFPEHLQKSWRQWCQTMLKYEPPQPIRPSTDFARGFCYAHEGYAVYNGYMGRESKVSLQRLRQLGANAISITPFGYTRDPKRPAPFMKSLGAGSENDESLVVAQRFAKQQGMTAMLKPHILLSGGHWGWPGEIDMENPADWPAFFKYYRRWITHYAILAQAYRFDSFVIGTELVHATQGKEAAWREIIAHIRKLYGGPITYAANWGDEFEKLGFWNALDAIGLDCYYPLSDNPDATKSELVLGAQRVAEKIGRIARQYNKPVILTEIGFASRKASWTNPHSDGRREAADETSQELAYEAVFKAFYGQPWLAGMYWWKWPTYVEDGGPHHSGFTPNGKAAERVVKKYYRNMGSN